MIELQVNRILREDQSLVEYRLDVRSVHRVETYLDEMIPDMYIAAYVVNALREYVLNAHLNEQVKTLVSEYREENTFTCPRCGQEIKGR